MSKTRQMYYCSVLASSTTTDNSSEFIVNHTECLYLALFTSMLVHCSIYTCGLVRNHWQDCVLCHLCVCVHMQGATLRNTAP